MAQWYVLVNQVDTIVDETMGEPIQLIPWVRLPYQMGEPDPERQPINTIGIFRYSKVVVNSQGAKTANPDIQVQVRDINMVGIRQYDRVRLLDPIRTDSVFEIEYIDPGNIRNTLHLIPLRDSPI